MIFIYVLAHNEQFVKNEQERMLAKIHIMNKKLIHCNKLVHKNVSLAKVNRSSLREVFTHDSGE